MTTPTADEPTESEVEEVTRPDFDAMAKRLVEDVKRETRHAVWARQTESSIRDTLQPILAAEPGISAESVYCASVRCAVEGEATSEVAFHKMSPAIMQMQGMGRARIRLTRKQDGTFEYRAIMARDGFDVEGAPKRKASAQTSE